MAARQRCWVLAYLTIRTLRFRVVYRYTYRCGVPPPFAVLGLQRMDIPFLACPRSRQRQPTSAVPTIPVVLLRTYACHHRACRRHLTPLLT